MNDLSLLNPTVLSMTSLEIASLVDSRHDNVKRTIETLAAKEVIKLPRSEEVENIQSLSPNKKTKVYVFSGPDGKRDSIVVVAQLSPEFTGRLVDRWQELEAKQGVTPMLPRTPQEMVVNLLQCRLKLADLFGIPTHIAQQEAVKYVEAESGTDLRPLLRLAPAQSAVSEAEVMLEPNDLAKAVGIASGSALNKWLASLGKQEKINGSWTPTEAGQPHCVKHAWSTLHKTGYNLKWNLEFVKSLLPNDWPINKVS